MLELFFFITAQAHPHAIWVARVITKAAYTVKQVSYGWTEAVIKKGYPTIFVRTSNAKTACKSQTRPDTRHSSRGWLGRSSNVKIAQS